MPDPELFGYAGLYAAILDNVSLQHHMSLWDCSASSAIDMMFTCLCKSGSIKCVGASAALQISLQLAPC